MEDSGSESEYSGTQGQGTPRLGTQILPEDQSTPIAAHPARAPAPIPVAGPAPPELQPALVHSSEDGSGVSESTAVALSDKPTRRKSVRLDVPPSLTPTPAAEDFPADPWKINMEDLANAVPSRSYLAGTQSTAATKRHSLQSNGPPPPQDKGLGLSAPEPEDNGGWHTRMSRASSGDSSDEDDEEYARAKRELEEANKHFAQAGHVGRRR